MVSEYDSEGNAKILYKRIRDLLFYLQILAIFLQQVLLDCATHFKMFYHNISYTTLRLQTKENYTGLIRSYHLFNTNHNNGRMSFEVLVEKITISDCPQLVPSQKRRHFHSERSTGSPFEFC